MRRRRFLAFVGAVLSAGCASRSDRSTPTVTPVPVEQPTPSPTSEPGDRPLDPTSTYRTLEIGDPSDVENPHDVRPHELYVSNRGDSPRDVGMRITVRRNGSDVVETILEDAFEIPADAALRIVVREPASYTIGVSPATADGPGRIAIPREAFDCNRHTYWVVVSPNGEIDVTEFSTAVGCVEPTSKDA